MSSFGTTTTLVMAALVMRLHPAVLEIVSLKFWSAGQPSLLYSRKTIDVTLKSEGNSLIITSLSVPMVGFSGSLAHKNELTLQVANSFCFAVMGPSVAAISTSKSLYAQGPKIALGCWTVYGPTVISLKPSTLQGPEIREQFSLTAPSDLPSLSKSAIWSFRLPVRLGQTIWVKWALFGIGGSAAWTAMLWSRSSVGRMFVHIVWGSVEGWLMRTMMGEVKEGSLWKEGMCRIYLIRVIREKMKCREYWLDIAVPWRLVSVECDEHLHRENSTVLIMRSVDANCLKPHKACQKYHIHYQFNDDS